MRVALALVLVAAAIIAFGGALRAPFQFDDLPSIPQNASIRALWPPTVPLSPPPGVSVSARPLVNLSLAANYAVNGILGIGQAPSAPGADETAGYHIVNLLIHLLCGALVFGIVRRTLTSGALRERWEAQGDAIAGAVTALWLLHPIQTEAVDYVIQRTELLVSFCYLGTLYASIRAWGAADAGGRIRWYAAAVVTCLAGMASKEVMITAPIVVMLYDRAFRARAAGNGESGDASPVTTPRDRVRFYVALTATAILSLSLIATGSRRDSVGFQLGVTWYEYLYSQAWAISHYLRLVFWPDGLTLDYGRDPVTGLRGLPGFVLLAALGVGTLVAWRKAKPLAFLGAWFFLVLAPSSSFVPIRTEIAAERRMYLALVPVLIAIVMGIELLRRALAAASGADRRRWLGAMLAVTATFYMVVAGPVSRRLGASFVAIDSMGASLSLALAWGWRLAIGIALAAVAWAVLRGHGRRWLVAAVGIGFLVTSAERSRLYADPVALWRDTVNKAPANARAHVLLAAAFLSANPPNIDYAESELRDAVRVDSTYLRASARLGALLVRTGRPNLAIPYLARAVTSQPTADDLTALGTAYLAIGQNDNAAGTLRAALALDPSRADALRNLGTALLKTGHSTEAVIYLEKSIELDRTSGFGYAWLSVAYAVLHRVPDAASAAATAAANGGSNAAVYALAGHTMLEIGRPNDAERYLGQAAHLDPDNPETLTELGVTVAALGKHKEAVQLLQLALRRDSTYAPARQALRDVAKAR